ncbi:2658_t:CDS:2 [Acaulospora morrowiae]|uniref:2658_t:CDS:1 n=1 Tax=Acaulospora morrowiae TaxID=94023 RepID=A0A9N8VPX1_9GLOM|nr:2658_t:CDS:2 [Acaulospora morrowiae]
MSMYYYENRLNSFTSKKKKWPHTDKNYKATPEMLAKAGFYYLPAPRSPDNVICFLCHKSMEGWDPTDDPNIEHITHSPECAWALCYCMTRKFADKKLPSNLDDDHSPSSKRMEELRLMTFGNWWPHEGKKGWIGTAKKMAKAGFVFASSIHTPDNVMCTYCEVSLGDWEQKDDPM